MDLNGQVNKNFHFVEVQCASDDEVAESSDKVVDPAPNIIKEGEEGNEELDDSAELHLKSIVDKEAFPTSLFRRGSRISST